MNGNFSEGIRQNQKCKSQQDGQRNPDQKSHVPIGLGSFMIGIVGLDSRKPDLPGHQPNWNQNHEDKHSYPSGDPDEWDEANQKEHPHADCHVSVKTRVAISSVDLVLNGGGGFGLGGIDRSRTEAALVHAGVYEFVTLWAWETAQLFRNHTSSSANLAEIILCELCAFA
jgi:hypothetical protein